MAKSAQAKHTARVMLVECRARRHAHGWEFAFRAAQGARRRVSALATPALATQMDLFS